MGRLDTPSTDSKHVEVKSADKRLFSIRRVPLEKAKKFDIKFEPADICILVKADVNPKFANEYIRYDSKLRPFDIKVLYQDKIKLEQFKLYNKGRKGEERFDSEALMHLITAKIKPKQVIAYDEKYDAYTIMNFIRDGISPDVEKKYNEGRSITEFNGEDISYLWIHDVKPGMADEYDYPRFSVQNICQFIENNANPDQVNDYDQDKFNAAEVWYFVQKKISPDQANGYKDEYHQFDIAFFVSKKIEPDEANKYKGYTAPDVLIRIQEKISPKKANSWWSRLKYKFFG